MKDNKNKVYIALISCILFCITIGGINYYIKTSTRNILMRSLYDSLENDKGYFDKELLTSYNVKNMDKLSKGEELAAEDYFLIAFEYCTIKKDRAEGIKYAAKVEEKKGIFTNRYSELYSELLIDYYYTYIQKDDDISKRIDEELSNMTIRDWNKYSNLLNSKLVLFINFDGGFDYIMNKAEEVLKDEDKLEAHTIVIIKDTLVAAYKQKGYHAKVLEMCMESKALLKERDIKYGDIYKARAQLNEAEVYAMLSDNEMAEKLLKEALEMDIKNESFRRDTKVTILNDLISIYFIEDDMDKILDLISKYKDIMKDNDTYNSDVLYYLSMAQYHMEKYEKDRSSKEDLSEAEEYIKLSRNCFTGHTGARSINISTHQSVYEIYLEYLKGNVDYALNKYNELFDELIDRNLEIDILQKMYKISSKEGRYKEASEYSAKLLELKNEESLLINKNYSAYSIEKYKNELEIRRMNNERIDNYIRGFAIILVLSIIIIIVIMKNRMLSQKSKCDGLTNINNRVYFNEIYDKKLKKNQYFYLYIFDIDNFKNVNDTYGHLIGDEVLKKIAEVGREIVGTRGKIFRYGGEEFVVIVDHFDENIVINMAEDIRKKIEELNWDNDMKITISMGIAYSAVEKEDVLEVADNRLYISKTTGKNKVTFKINI